MRHREYMYKTVRGHLTDGLYACATPTLRSGTIVVPLTAGLCLVLLALVLKNILLLPADKLASDLVLYIVLYMGLIVSFPLGETGKIAPFSRTMIWTGGIILITIGIIAYTAI
jgi:hypothetical protein